MKYVIIDFEVFKYDTLLGALITDGSNIEIKQTWDLNEIRAFYREHVNDIWIGHNNIGYDNIILEACVKDKDIYKTSKSIIDGFRPRCNLPILTHDTMRGFYSLKATEMCVGKNISETPIDFDIDRKLTDEERLQIESYNRDDLQQTYENFIAQYDDFSMRLEIIKEFNLPLKMLTVSGTKLAAVVLGAKAIDGIENMKVETKLPSTLQIKHQEVIDFYLNEDFRKKGKSVKLNLCNCEHNIMAGGIHAALKKVHYDRVMYFDVSGYYNLVMLNYGLLPRTMPDESKEKYRWMYYEQLRLKKINPRKRGVYKTILLSVFGAMMNKYTDFYDPYHGSLVTITGELFLVDLLEKLEGIVQVIQSNTDGIMLVPYDWNDKDKVIKIVEEWENRTGFVIKKEELTNLWQRDVNNYMFDNNGTPVAKGEAVNTYGKSESPIWHQAWTAKEPEIIAKGIVDYLVYNVTPEETVEKCKRQLILFQYACKAMSFDYCVYETIDKNGNQTRVRLQNINRAFASNDDNIIGTVIKCKDDETAKVKRARIQSLPPNVFIYNNDIRDSETVDELVKRIDYNYYINRIYERCGEFIEKKED